MLSCCSRRPDLLPDADDVPVVGERAHQTKNTERTGKQHLKSPESRPDPRGPSVRRPSTWRSTSIRGLCKRTRQTA